MKRENMYRSFDYFDCIGVLRLLLEGSGFTWRELCQAHGFAPEDHNEGPMDLASCLWELDEAGLIEIDGIEREQIRAFVAEQLRLSYSQSDDATFPSTMRIRASRGWRKIQRTFSIDLDELIKRKNAFSLTTYPLFGKPVDLPSRAEVFVLMPFTEVLRPIYQDHLSRVATELGLSMMRADDLFTSNSVISDIWAGIMGAKIIIAECTGRNPNVFYEIGMAHTIGKPTILITQNQEDVPVDLRHIKYIRYDYTPRGMAKLEKALVKTLCGTLKLKSPNPTLNRTDTALSRDPAG